MVSTLHEDRARTSVSSGGPGLFPALLLLVGLIAPAVAAAQSRAAAQPGTTPARIAAVPVMVRLTVADSGQAAQVEVVNEGATQAQLRFYLGDFEQAEDGSFAFLPFGKGSHSCGAHLTTFPDGAVLLGGERQQVQVRLGGGAGVCWSILFVEVQPQGRGPIKVVQRIGVKIQNSPPGTTRQGEVSSVTARRVRRDSLSVHTVFANTGAAPLEIAGRVEVRDYSGKVVAQSEFGPLGSLPGRPRAFDTDIAARLPRGDYVVVPIVDFGGDYIAGGQTTLKVP